MSLPSRILVLQTTSFSQYSYRQRKQRIGVLQRSMSPQSDAIIRVFIFLYVSCANFVKLVLHSIQCKCRKTHNKRIPTPSQIYKQIQLAVVVFGNDIWPAFGTLFIAKRRQLLHFILNRSIIRSWTIVANWLEYFRFAKHTNSI